jgi:hypothetical protein
MATIVEMSQPILVSQQSGALSSHDVDLQPSSDQSNEKAAADLSDVKQDGNGDKAGKKDGKENGPKIFDNKTFVEAPIPKTNPWNKPGASNPAPSNPTPVPTAAKQGEIFDYISMCLTDCIRGCFFILVTYTRRGREICHIADNLIKIDINICPLIIIFS